MLIMAHKNSSGDTVSTTKKLESPGQRKLEDIDWFPVGLRHLPRRARGPVDQRPVRKRRLGARRVYDRFLG